MCQGGEAANQATTWAAVHKENPVRANRRYAPVPKRYPIFARISGCKKKRQNHHDSSEQQLNPLMCAKAFFEIDDVVSRFAHLEPALARAPMNIEIALYIISFLPLGLP